MACADCNLHKGPNLTTIDLATRQIVALFHPRYDIWDDHFEFDGPRVVGKSVVGKATVRLLQMNSNSRVRLRQTILDEGEAL